MSLKIGNGKVLITEGTRTVFDTDEKLFHILGAVSGITPSMGYAGGNNVGYDLDDYLVLGNVPAACTQVIGAAKFTLNNYAAALAFDRWHTVMGGTLVWVLDGEPGFQDRLGWNAGVKQVATYTFAVVAGEVRLYRRVILDTSPAAVFVRPHAIEYRLKCGIWV